MRQPENGRHVAALSRVATALNSALSLDEVLDISIRSGLDLTGLDSGVIYVAEEDTSRLVGRSHHGFENGLTRGIDVHRLRTSQTLAVRAFRSAEPLTFDADDPKTGYASLSARESTAVRRAGIRSAVAVQLRSATRVHGCLVLCSNDETSRVTAEEIALTQVIAGQVAVAIERARLFEATRNHAAETEALYDFGQRFGTRVPIEDSLQYVVDRVAEHFDGPVCAIELRHHVDSPVLIRPWRATGDDDVRGKALPLTRAGLELGSLHVSRTALTRSTPFFRSLADLVSMALHQRMLGEANERLSLLAERTRLARDIHDGLIQRFYALDLSLTAAGRALEVSGDVGRTASLIGEARQQARAGVNEARAAITELRRDAPAGGLLPGTRLLADDFSNRTGVSCTVVCATEEPELATLLGSTLLRCLRELLLNVEKHANASRVEIAVEVSDARLTVSVTDDGVGIGRDARAPGHFGLAGVAEQMDEVGGAMRVLEPARGTCVELACATGASWADER
ncbi:MAG: GAF domain-containing protein [Nocardioidaceae bacterium]|nr:GAF domain-containing protein [Nocardioidaceae bacterium]